MYVRISKSVTIVNLYRLRGMPNLKLKINVNPPQLLCIVVSVALNGECERFGGFCVDCYYKPTQTPPNRLNSPFRATETTTNNNWGGFTFILSFNLDIPRYKFTILRLFHILPYISLYLEQTTRLAACVGPREPTLLKLSAFDLKELDLLTSRFFCHSTKEEGKSATTRNQATFV